MPQPEIEVKFTVPITEIPEEHRLAAERKAHEAFIMELLRQGDISGGRAGRLLNVNRSQLSKLMYEYGISPFDETITQEDLEREVGNCIQMLENHSQ